MWGGREGCAHEWQLETTIAGNNKPSAKSTLEDHGDDGRSPYLDAQAGREVAQGFCHHCNAWRGSLGLEPTPALYVVHIVEVMREVRRVLRDDGTVWLNLADSRAKRPFKPWGIKVKDECGIPYEVKRALRMDGWYTRSSIVWAKGVSFCKTYSGSCMPESVRDRPTNSYEMVFLLSKSARYYYDQEAVKEANSQHPASVERMRYPVNKPVGTLDGMGTWGQSGKTRWDHTVRGRNLRSVWLINPSGSSRNHYAAYPEALVRPMIRAGTSARGVCPECGVGWVRVTEKSPSDWAERKANGATGGTLTLGHNSTHGEGTDHTLGQRETTTLGWQPSCTCDAGDPIPATVLDCFVGSGTTCHVAESLGRDSIGIDLSGDYVEMSRRRVNRVEQVETVLNGETVTVEQVPMWEVAG